MSLHWWERSNSYGVFISGNDDTDLGKKFSSLEEALALYNALSYVQSLADLSVFDSPDPDCFSNGWPYERTVFTAAWYDNQQEEDAFNFRNEYQFPLKTFGES